MFLVRILVGGLGDGLEVDYGVEVGLVGVGLVVRLENDVEFIEGEVGEGDGGPVAVGEDVSGELSLASDGKFLDQCAVVLAENIAVECRELVVDHHQVIELEDEGESVDLIVDFRQQVFDGEGHCFDQGLGAQRQSHFLGRQPALSSPEHIKERHVLKEVKLVKQQFERRANERILDPAECSQNGDQQQQLSDPAKHRLVRSCERAEAN
jgi:hypothetical protein